VPADFIGFMESQAPISLGTYVLVIGRVMSQHTSMQLASRSPIMMS
jgi:hypothetical protein